MKKSLSKGSENQLPEIVPSRKVSWWNRSMFGWITKVFFKLLPQRMQRERLINHKLKKTNADGSSIESNFTYWDKES